MQLSPAMLFKRTYSQARRSRRQWINTSVHVFAGSAQFSAVGINLSEGGMGLFAVVNLPVGSQVTVEFPPPGENEPVRLSAKIRHRALYLYGVEFLESGAHASEAKVLAAQNSHPISSESRTF